MKKLLALLLCLAMIGSISVAAFAKSTNDPSFINNNTVRDPGSLGSPGGSNTAARIDLYPIVKQANHYYGALRVNDVMRKTVNLYNGFAEAFHELLQNNKSLHGAMYALEGMFLVFKEAGFDPNTGELILPTVENEETHEKIVSDSNTINMLVSVIWDRFANAYAGEFDGNLGNANSGTITGAIANAENNMPTVTAPAGWGPVPG